MRLKPEKKNCNLLIPRNGLRYCRKKESTINPFPAGDKQQVFISGLTPMGYLLLCKSTGYNT